MVLPYIDMNLPRVYMCPLSWTPLPPPFPSHPSGSSQCTSPEHPVPCIKPGLATRFTYDNIHVSMLFSQIIPPSPHPQSPKDCSIHLYLFCCLTYRVIVTIFLNSIYMRYNILWKSWLKAWHSENKDHGIWSHHFMGNRWGNSGNRVRLYFWGLQNHCRWWLQPWN